MKKTLKRGPASSKEREYIAANCDLMSVDKIAANLRRSEAFVRKYIVVAPTMAKVEEQGDWISRLHASPFWAEIKRGLIGSEVGYFENAWSGFCTQFGSQTDILATDDLMIKDLAILDIFSQRAISEQANVIRQIDSLHRSIDAEEEKDFEARDQASVSDWRTQVNTLLIAKTSIAKQHLDCQTRKDAKLRDLKGSRDQRFKQIEESRSNIFELLKSLDERKSRMKEGKLAAKVAVAAKKVADDWNEVFEFEDGTADKPFLSPEGEERDRLQNEQEQASGVQDEHGDSEL